MKIIKMSTPNKSRRKRAIKDIDLAIVHYTGSTNVDGTVSWFKNKIAKVSSQYVIDRNGDVYQFETPMTICWHAGVSYWNGKNGCNNRSIGYELVGNYSLGFTNEQYDSLNQLLVENMVSFPFINSVVGHEHVAPGRKIDPGINFYWDRVGLALKNANLYKRLKYLGGRPVNLEIRGSATMESGKDPMIQLIL
jgi:N-acetyl-anhydromuramyl-L-alanine amidase AmpD